jgi:hypothetical protein
VSRSRSLLLLLAVSLAACDSFTGHPEPREADADVPCGAAGETVDARQLIGLSVDEAAEVGRRHGCVVRVEVRDGRVVANRDVEHLRTSVGVIVEDAHVAGLC